MGEAHHRPPPPKRPCADKDLIEAGIHFGQRRSNWNPKMKPYIYGLRNKIHVVDIRQTVKGLLLAKKFVQRTVAEGKDVCFVGTKRQARAAVEKYAQDVGMPYVIERWLGGTLTNYRTIRERLARLEELEKLVESGEIENYSKKMASQLLREQRKITRNLQGIRNMDKHPGCLVVVDVNREINALREARSLGIPTVALIDTDGDPDLADIPIPGNDDSMRSIDVVIRELCEAVTAGKAGRTAEGETEKPAEETTQAGRRRSTRAMYRAEQPAVEPPKADAAAEPAAEPAPAGEPAPVPAAKPVAPAPAAEPRTEAEPPPPAPEEAPEPAPTTPAVGGPESAPQ
ncbi:MAG: 30S ribosomal protein S2 [Planctomycetota bacterium]